MVCTESSVHQEFCAEEPVHFFWHDLGVVCCLCVVDNGYILCVFVCAVWMLHVL